MSERKTRPLNRAETDPKTEADFLLGSLLRMYRQRRGLTLTKLAAKIRMGRGQLCIYEKGHKFPTLISLFKILKGLEVEPWVFFLRLKQMAEDEPPVTEVLSDRTNLPAHLEDCLKKVNASFFELWQMLIESNSLPRKSP